MGTVKSASASVSDRTLPAQAPTARAERIASFPPVIRQNPYQRLLYESLADFGFSLEQDATFKVGWLAGARHRVTLLHFHWPQLYYRHSRGPRTLRTVLSWIRLGVLAVRLGAARLLGYRIVWTIHQVFPHETFNRRLDRVAARILAQFSHLLIAHDEFTADQARTELSARAVEVVPHGSYLGVYARGRPRPVVRGSWDVDDRAFVFLCFGHLRAYKDLDLLLEAFARVSNPDAVLAVAGMGLDPTVVELLRAAQSADPRVRSLVGFVPEEHVAEMFGACDVAVFPRGDGGTSGSLILALSLGLPVIAARRPAYCELVDPDAGWMFDAGVAASLAAAMEDAATDASVLHAKGQASLRVAERLSWADTASRTSRLFRALAPTLSGG